MKKLLYSKSLKMALAATISTLIADYFNLQFGVTAGIISILSIQSTKREAIIVSLKRFLAVIIALSLSYVLYIILGKNPIIFGLYLLIFIPITSKLKIEEGLVVGSVLSGHLLTSNNINMRWIANEIGLTIIGMSVAMLFNLYTVSLEDDFENNREKIEDQYKLILLDLSRNLLTNMLPDNEPFNTAEKLIYETKDMAQKICNNQLFSKNEYYLSYIEMRIMQFDTLKKMKKHFSRFYMTYDQTMMLSELTKNVALNIYVDNDCVELIGKLDLLRGEYRKMDLPKNRDEFENRALLYQYLNDLEDFLVIKREYIRL